MATLVSTLVDTDGTVGVGGVDYLSLSAADSDNFGATSVDLVTNDEYCECSCQASSGTADTTEVTITGFTTDATRYIEIKAASGHEAVKTGIDATRYRLSVTDPDTASLGIRNDFVRVTGLQIQLGYSASAYKIALRFADQGASNDIRASNCYIAGPGNSASGASGISTVDTDSDATIVNTILTGFDEVGLRCAGTVALYHCIVYGTTGDGVFVATGATTTITNCALFNNNDDLDNRGTTTIDHCASDDGDGTNAVTAAGTPASWANEFSDAANGDFTLLNTGNLYQGGTTIAGGPSTDIDGDSWGATPSIGVDEYGAAPASATIPVLMHHYRRMRT